LTLKGGLGLRLNTLPATWYSLWALVGIGGRFTFTGDMYKDADIDDTDQFEVELVDSFRAYGLESSVVLQLALSRWVVASSEFEGFAPFDDLAKPTLLWDSNLGLRLTSFVSVNYGYRMVYQPEINEDFQHDHRVQLRFSYKFF